MDVLLQQATSRQSIDGYGNGGFTISGTRYEGNILITLQECFPVPDIAWDTLTPEVLIDSIKTLQDIEVLLIGSGLRTQLLSPVLRSALRSRGMAIDVLDSGAACRTFNVLASEDRRVAALLFAI